MPPILVPFSGKHIATQFFVIPKLNGTKYLFLERGSVYDIICPYKKLPIPS